MKALTMILLVGAVWAAAQKSAAPRKHDYRLLHHFRGTVTEVYPDSGNFKVARGGKGLDFSVEDGFKVATEGGKNVGLEDLKPGDRVAVAYTQSSHSGTPRVKTIFLEAPEDQGRASSEPAAPLSPSTEPR
jgi:hypothetical protein